MKKFFKTCAVYAGIIMAMAMTGCGRYNGATVKTDNESGMTYSTSKFENSGIVVQELSGDESVVVDFKEQKMCKSVKSNGQSDWRVFTDLCYSFNELKDSADIAKVKELHQYLPNTPAPVFGAAVK